MHKIWDCRRENPFGDLEQLTMTPSENDLLVHFDQAQQKLVIYRLLSPELPAKVIHTEYALNELKSKGIDQASKLLGEDILASLQGTRGTLI